MRKLLLLLLVLFPMLGMAQERYTDQLKHRSSAGATIILYQDSIIEEMVNGDLSANPSADSLRMRTVKDKRIVKTQGSYTRINGYRVQIYMAGNTAADKTTVKNWARRFKNYFPAVNAYVYFNSPHWVCSVGDYVTREDAQAMLNQIRATGQFSSASIVRSKINNFY